MARAASGLLVAAALVGMNGCANGQPTRLYTLTPTVAAAETAAGETSECIGIGPVTLPGFLDHRQIVTRRNESEVERADFEHWAEPLEDAIPRVLVEDLTALLGPRRIQVRPWNSSGHCQNQLLVDVARFDGMLGQSVVLDARWRIRGKDGQEFPAHRAVLTEVTRGASYRDLVKSMSGALGALSQEIASAVIGTGRPVEAGVAQP
jgi:uncharacterized lipoprotein YmbA